MRPFLDQGQIIYRLATALADSGSSFSAKLRQSLGIIREELQAEDSLLQLYSGSQEAFSLGENGGLLSRETRENPPWKEITRYVNSNREPVQINDIRNDPRFGDASSEEENRNYALLASPLFLGDSSGTTGVILLANSTGFTDEDLDNLTLLGQWLSPFIADRLQTGDYPLQEPEEGNNPFAGEKAAPSPPHADEIEELEFIIHDLKSPLAALMTNLDLLQSISQSEKQASLAHTALKSANKLYQRITQFLDYSRFESLSPRDADPYPVDLEQAVSKQIQEHQSLLDKKEIEINTDGATGIEVFAEESLLHHLLQNLLSNAIHHTPYRGHIALSWITRKAMRKEDISSSITTVSVEDSGEGIPDRKKQKVLRSMEQGRRSLAKSGELGLGLLICSRIIHILQGTLWIEDALP
ncbi:MAG: GAF domain-containing protein, partial [Desulfohalobiaceae bacterium]|nr:GAF domain-containing protein [Desulfohalobiaceae bacterium]